MAKATATVRSVWIHDTCIICNSCESTAPEIFDCAGEVAHIRAGMRADGATDANPTHAPLTIEGQEWSEAILEAAAGCPVEAIAVAMV